MGLYALQHRGQESAGIAAFSGEHLTVVKNQGLVSEALPPEVLDELPGTSAIGHVRYSTTGASRACNAQPLRANYQGGKLAVAHNGNLTNSDEVARAVEANGAIFQSTTDSELLLHLIAQNRSTDFREALLTSLRRLRGAFSMVVLRDGDLYACKDPNGFRPLCVGKLEGGGWIVASESCALDIVGAQYLRELDAGEVMCFKDGLPDREVVLDDPTVGAPKQTFCVFELIYYSRPDSLTEGKSIYHNRQKLGDQLAREAPTNADVVVPIPDSSNPAAMGYARAAGLPMELGLIRSHYVGRTFIQPTQGMRDFGAKVKYNPVTDILAGRRVVLVDDSIVRGTTARKIVRMVRDAGATEVHLRITAPPWRHPCFYGIDTPDEAGLIANQLSVDEMRGHFGVDSIGFLSLDGLMKTVPKTQSYCTTCFTGKYPSGRPSGAAASKLKLEGAGVS